MALISKSAGLAGMAAAISMAATPAHAAEFSDLSSAGAAVPFATPGVFDAEAVNANGHRRYRGYRHRRAGVGDVLAGVLIIGGIAAIASAASKNRDNDRYRDRDYRNRDYRDRDYRTRRGDSRTDSSRGIDNAVNRCVSRIERDVRVEAVDGVDRTGEGWRVTGSIYNGDSFACDIGSDGRIEDIQYGAGFADNRVAPQPRGRQHSDDRYAAAWSAADRGDIDAPARTDRVADIRQVQTQDEAQPAYPGGPLPGDEYPGGDYPAQADRSASQAETGAIDGDLSSSDDRYRTAEAPDFTT